MKGLFYARIYKSQEYLASLGTIHYRLLFGGYSLMVDDTVFVMVVNGGLYLRAREQSIQCCAQDSPAWLTFIKRERPLVLNYYQVSDALWQNQQQLVSLSRYSLDVMAKEKQSCFVQHYLRELPNMTPHLGTLLNEAGIRDGGIM